MRVRIPVEISLARGGIALTSSVPEGVGVRIEDDRIIIEIPGEQGSSELSVTQSGTELSVASVGSAPLRS